MESEKIPERAQALKENTWALEDLYPTDEAWQADFDALRALIARVPDYAGKLGADANTLLAYMRLDDQMGLLLENLINYAQRRSDEDTRVAAYQAMVGKITSLWVEAAGAAAFEQPELLKIPEETLERFYADEPALTLYRRYFDNVRRRRAHILSDAEEKLLAAAGEMAQAPDSIFSMLNDADLKFPDAVDADGKAHPLTSGTFIPYLESADRVLRKSAFETLYRTYGGVRNTNAAVLSSQVKQLRFFASARRYETPLHAALDGTHVPVEVYENLVDTVNENLDKMHRYVRLRKKLLGLDELHMYDVYTPIVPGSREKIPYEKAKLLVSEALAPMGKEYGALLQEGFDHRWIDVYENTGKRSGAYSAGAKAHPYVLLNYTGNLDSVFTLAHEMGHALHSWYSNSTQPFRYADYVIFVAEVASTCNEALLMKHLLNTTTDRLERAYLINHFLDQFKGTLYRQTMFAEFEQSIGRLDAAGESLTAERLSAEYRALNAKYYGPDMVLDPEIDLEWSRIPHFYYDYYVYQYATGYAAAIALSQRILREGEPAVTDYVNFLKGGCSRDPIDLLRGAGVDMSSRAPVEDALRLFGELLSQMEELTA